MKVYLDNCCYNRPYDDQSLMRVSLETQAKIHVQDLIKEEKLNLVSSFILHYENSQNPFESRKRAILKFIADNSSQYVSEAEFDEVHCIAEEIMKSGIKTKDALHVACAIFAGCDVFL